ncbi:DUF3418 domain-containing protein [Escherichia coli]
MERQLRRMTGVTVPRESWDWAAVPDHLKLTFRVVDDKHKKVAEGKGSGGIERVAARQGAGDSVTSGGR